MRQPAMQRPAHHAYSRTISMHVGVGEKPATERHLLVSCCITKPLVFMDQSAIHGCNGVEDCVKLVAFRYPNPKCVEECLLLRGPLEKARFDRPNVEPRCVANLERDLLDLRAHAPDDFLAPAIGPDARMGAALSGKVR